MNRDARTASRVGSAPRAPPSRSPALKPLALLLLSACAAPAFRVQSSPAAAGDAAQVEARLLAARPAVEAALGVPLRTPVQVTLAATRAEFDATFPPEWGVPGTECWMVAWGVADRMAVLAPGAWATQACEHDAADAGHVQRLLAHELVHVLHGQHNGHPDFTGLDDIGWFVEGLGVLASGQLDAEHAGRARQALAEGRGPRDLAGAWSGPYRYATCGSLVRFWSGRAGPDGLARGLSATGNAELLAATGLDEPAFLDAWAAWVRAGG